MEKREKYEAHRGDLAQQGIVYEPIIFSAYGRRHPRTTDMLKLAASKAARRRGWSKTGGLLKWWHRRLAAELWRRAARMVHACTPIFEARAEDAMGEEEDDGEAGGLGESGPAGIAT